MIFEPILFKESTPSVLINLLGMMIGNRILNKTLEDKAISKLSFLFIYICIVGMKNGLELAYAMDVATVERERRMYIKIAVDKSHKLILQTSILGILIGLIGGLISIFRIGRINRLFLQIIFTSTWSCILSTLGFIFSFIFGSTIIHYFHINSENFAIPILGTLNDLMVIQVLSTVARISLTHSTNTLLWFIVLSIIILIICAVFVFKKEQTMRNIYSSKKMIICFIINIITGVITDDAAIEYPIINNVYHLFSTLAGSITYIFTNKIFVATKNNLFLKKSINYTLIIISVFCSIIYTLISLIFYWKIPTRFLVLFVITMTLQIWLVNESLLFLSFYPKTTKSFKSTDIILLVGALSDLISIVSVILISNIVYQS